MNASSSSSGPDVSSGSGVSSCSSVSDVSGVSSVSGGLDKPEEGCCAASTSSCQPQEEEGSLSDLDSDVEQYIASEKEVKYFPIRNIFTLLLVGDCR